MATSPLFGWQEPDDTSLVKDGAAAIRTLGNAIDTSMGDLLGGTTGQVLAKASNTNMDFTWVAQDDSNAIQNAIVDAKGDLIAASAADTPARLAVGANGLSLVADSAQSTGLKWGTPSSKGLVLANSTTQAVNNITDTTLSWDTEFWDTDGFHSTTTNPSRITIPAGLGGKYLLDGVLAVGANATGLRYASFKQNGGASFYTASSQGNGTYSTFVSFSIILNLAASDYIEMTTFQNSGGSLNVLTESRVTFSYLGA